MAEKTREKNELNNREIKTLSLHRSGVDADRFSPFYGNGSNFGFTNNRINS